MKAASNLAADVDDNPGIVLPGNMMPKRQLAYTA
jgi:hypothetical protein